MHGYSITRVMATRKQLAKRITALKDQARRRLTRLARTDALGEFSALGRRLRAIGVPKMAPKKRGRKTARKAGKTKRRARTQRGG